MQKKIDAGQKLEIAAAVGLCLFVSAILLLFAPAGGEAAHGVFMIWLLSLALAAGACLDVFRRSRAALLTLCASGALLAAAFALCGLLFFFHAPAAALFLLFGAVWPSLPIFLALAERCDRQRRSPFRQSDSLTE